MYDLNGKFFLVYTKYYGGVKFNADSYILLSHTYTHARTQFFTTLLYSSSTLYNNFEQHGC